MDSPHHRRSVGLRSSMDSGQSRLAAAPYHRPVSSRNFKFVQATKVQCDTSSVSSEDTDDVEEYFRFHQYCALPGEDLEWLRPRQRPLKFTTRNRLSGSPILTTAHASAISPSANSVIVKSPALGWFGKLKAKLRGKRNEHKKSPKTLFDLSHFNKKMTRRSAVAQRSPNSPDTRVSGNSSRISSIRSAFSTLSRKTKEIFPFLSNRVQRNPGRPTGVLRSRKEAIATSLITLKKKPTTSLTYEPPDFTTVPRSGCHMRSLSDDTTVSSFLGSEGSDETANSASTAPTSVISTPNAARSSSAPAVTRNMDHLHKGTNLTTQFPDLSMTPPHEPATAIRYVSPGTPRLVSIGNSITPTADPLDDTHVRTKPLGFKRTKRPHPVRDPSSSSSVFFSYDAHFSTQKHTRDASASGGLVFDRPVGSNLPVSTPHARIASVSDGIKAELGVGVPELGGPV